MAEVDDQLIDEFMRVSETEDGYVLEVGVVGWDGPHTPFITWKGFRKWRHAPNPQRLAAAQQKALQESRFFKICSYCHERNNAGHMLEDNVCQECGKRYLGVVY